MVKLFCALVNESDGAFLVDIDDTKSVGDLKDAIKASREDITGSSRRLELYSAKRGVIYLTYNDLTEGYDVEDLKYLKNATRTLRQYNLGDKDVTHPCDRRQIAARNGPIHVLVFPDWDAFFRSTVRLRFHNKEVSRAFIPGIHVTLYLLIVGFLHE